MKQFKITKTIKTVTFIRNSYVGGPRAKIEFIDNTTATTKNNAPIGYRASSIWEGKTKSFIAHYTRNNNLILDIEEE